MWVRGFLRNYSIMIKKMLIEKEKVDKLKNGEKAAILKLVLHVYVTVFIVIQW